MNDIKNMLEQELRDDFKSMLEDILHVGRRTWDIQMADKPAEFTILMLAIKNYLNK